MLELIFWCSELLGDKVIIVLPVNVLVTLIAAITSHCLVCSVTGIYWLNKQLSDSSLLFANILPNQISLWYSLSEIIKHSIFRYRLDLFI